VFPTRIKKEVSMVFFLMVVSFGVIYKLGHGAGEVRERSRHKRAVEEAQDNITSLDGWKR
jgi:hypothetical protein